jgi:very-short-patch-repair endonuclease
VASAAQLLDAGLTRRKISVRIERRLLHRVHQGVYAVGHPGLSQHGRWMAAVLACDQEGREALLSHRSAAELWGLLSTSRGMIDVTVRGDGGRKRRQGIRVHRSRTLTSIAITSRLGVPATTPARTITDLRRTKPSRGGANAEQLRWALRQADILGLPVDEPLPDGTRSDLELLFVDICRRHRLPTPEVNSVVAGIEVDFLWRRQGVIVETDSWRYHRGRVAFENDRDRALRLRGMGFEVIRLSETQVEQEPDIVVSVLTCLLRG